MTTIKFRLAIVYGLFSLLLCADNSQAALVGLWRFDSDVPVQPDSTANSNNATPNGNAAWVFDGVRNSGTMSFDGNNDFLNVADSTSLSITGDITVAAWINVGNTIGTFNNWRGVVGKGTVGTDKPASYQFWFNQNDLNPAFLRGDGTNQQLTTAGAANAPAQNTWQHWAVAMSGTSVTFYRNGSQVGSTGNISVSMGDNDGPLYIGNRPDLQLDWLGRMDDVAIFDEALSAGQIGNIMSGDFTAFGVPEPSAIWLFTAASAVLAFRMRAVRMKFRRI